MQTILIIGYIIIALIALASGDWRQLAFVGWCFGFYLLVNLAVWIKDKATPEETRRPVVAFIDSLGASAVRFSTLWIAARAVLRWDSTMELAQNSGGFIDFMVRFWGGR